MTQHVAVRRDREALDRRACLKQLRTGEVIAVKKSWPCSIEVFVQ
jgi:hypothetical protein